MASTYTNDDAVTAFLGTDRRLALLDRDDDGTADTGLLDSIIEKAGNMIDMRLAQRFGTRSPLFPLIDADPATPGPIQGIALDLVLWMLYSHLEPDGRDARYHFGLADTMLTGIADGKFDVDVARAEANEGGVIAVYEAEDPTFAGLDDNDVSRLRGI